MVVEFDSPPAAGYAICDFQPTRFIIGPVAILPDGRIERTEEFTTTDDAAMEFWRAVERAVPGFLRREQPALFRGWPDGGDDRLTGVRRVSAAEAVHDTVRPRRR